MCDLQHDAAADQPAFVGQGVGLIDSVKSATSVVQEFKADFLDAVEHLDGLVAS